MTDTLDTDYLKSILDYNPTTGICIWKPRPRTDFRYARELKAWNNRHVGEQLHYVNPSNGKLTISLFGKTYPLDSIIYQMVAGHRTKVFHKNNCNVDNSWDNLSIEPTGKATKYDGGELFLGTLPNGLIAIASGNITDQIEIRPDTHIFNLFTKRPQARTYLLELADKLETGWNILDD